jgi:hypothetical protein
MLLFYTRQFEQVQLPSTSKETSLLVTDKLRALKKIKSPRNEVSHILDASRKCSGHLFPTGDHPLGFTALHYTTVHRRLQKPQEQ